MPVVINEFELATEPPRRAEEPASPQQGKERGGEPRPQPPEALACALRALSRRAARLRAD